MYPSNPNLYPSSHWGGASQHHSSSYPTSAGNFPPVSFASSPSHNHSGAAHQAASPFATTSVRTGGVPYTSYSTTSYSSGGSPTSPHQQSMYPLTNSIPSPHSPRHSHTHSHTHSHSLLQSHSVSNSRPRSHSQSHPYLPPPQSPSHSSGMTHQLQASQYPAQVPFAQTISIGTQYPASPSRPFSCDMCALSFNRAHDLSRHRQTHTGEKPFMCNGGCGKSFTRFVSILSQVKPPNLPHHDVEQAGCTQETSGLVGNLLISFHHLPNVSWSSNAGKSKRHGRDSGRSLFHR